MTHPLPAPDWYPDPVDRRIARWWDGAAWTPHWQWLGPPAAVPYPGQPYPSQPHRVQPYPVQPYPSPPAADVTGRGPALDRHQARLRMLSPQPWGWRPVVIPLVALAGLILVTALVSDLVTPHGAAARLAYGLTATVLVYGLFAVSAWIGGRSVAAGNDGWATFGLRRPRWIDLAWAAAGLGITFVAEIVVGVIAAALSHGRAAAQAQNLHVDHPDVATVVVLVATAVVAAPILEELVFRGLLLRTFMRRLRFWPAAVLSTAVFALGHTYEVSTLVGAATLAAGVGCLGLTNCWLNRRADSLIPGMIVHATFNLVAVVVVVAGAR